MESGRRQRLDRRASAEPNYNSIFQLTDYANGSWIKPLRDPAGTGTSRYIYASTISAFKDCTKAITSLRSVSETLHASRVALTWPKCRPMDGALPDPTDRSLAACPVQPTLLKMQNRCPLRPVAMAQCTIRQRPRLLWPTLLSCEVVCPT